MNIINRTTPRLSSILFLLALSSFMPLQAQRITDSAHNQSILLAVADPEEPGTTVIVKESNVVYPKLLNNVKDKAAEHIEKFSVNRRSYLLRMYKKGKKFFPKINKVLRKYHLPEEYRVLIALESAFNGDAVSKAGAVGYWQIMDEVAKEYGLTYEKQLTEEEKKKLEKETANDSTAAKKPVIKDDRRNFIKSTQAAARYLRDRSRNLDNDPLLVVASYNCGIGNVWSAMRKAGLSNPDFWDIKNYLPSETRNYVMNFIALNVIFNNYEKFASNRLNFKDIIIKADKAEASSEAKTAVAINK